MMKKIFWYNCIVIVVLFVCSTTFLLKIQSRNSSDLILANVEALTTGAEPGGSTSEASKICWVTVSSDPKLGVLSDTWYCGDCTEVPYTSRSNQLTCKISKK